MTTPPPHVPLVDLGWQRDRIADEVAAGWSDVLAETSFVLGPAVTRFERSYAEYCGATHCIGVGNGTDGLELALRAVGVGPGNEVVLPANTFVATAEAVSRTGADIVLVDCTGDHLIDIEAAAAAVTPRTRAVVAVHLYGQLVDVDALRDAVGDAVSVVEDAAQSQGARLRDRVSGALGHVASTSFYPGKNLGAYGDAGAVTTDDDFVGERVRQLRNHGGLAKYEHAVIGLNSRLDSLQAVVLEAKLRRLDEWNALRQQAASRYDELLADVPVLRPSGIGSAAHVWHLYVVRTRSRDTVAAAMTASGIGVGVHYPAPVHRLPAYSHLPYIGGAFPNAEAMSAEILSLPMFPGITVDQQERVVEALQAALGASAGHIAV